MDLEALIYQRELEVFRPADLIQATLLFWNAYLRLTVAPFPPARSFPKADSPWFPRKDIPARITFPLPTPHEIVLGTVRVEEEAGIPSTLSGIGFCAETGLSLPGVDVSLLYYQGWDLDLVSTSRIELPPAPGYLGSFDVVITPVHRYIRALAANVAASFDALRLWLDSSFTFGKSFNTTRLSSSDLTTLLARRHYWEYAVGASYELPWLDTLLAAEFKGDLVAAAGSESSEVVKNLLSSAFVGSVRSSFFDRRLAASIVVLVAAADGSTALLLSLSYEPASELKLTLYGPVFLGGPDTELGQFAENHLVSAAVQWRF
jgi:hypothetical protein